MNHKLRDLLRSICVAMIGFAVGCFFADNSTEVLRLRSVLEQMERAQQRQPRVPRTRGGTIVGRATSSASPQTNIQSGTTSDLLSRAKVTTEDMQETLELQRRQAQAEFILH